MSLVTSAVYLKDLALNETASNDWSNECLGEFLLSQGMNPLIGKSSSGRPVAMGGFDISLSHKEKVAYVGCVEKPLKLGLDLEYYDRPCGTLGEFIKSNNLETFSRFERDFVGDPKIFPTIWWSAIEAFFKCFDLELRPLQLGLDFEILTGGKRISFFPRSLSEFRRLSCGGELVSWEVELLGNWIYSFCIGKEYE